MQSARCPQERVVPKRMRAPRTAQEDGTVAKRPAAKEIIRITGMETLLVKPRWLFLKIHTNAGITGLGEPITEGRARTCAEAVKEIEPYLIGKDPRAVTITGRRSTATPSIAAGPS